MAFSCADLFAFGSRVSRTGIIPKHGQICEANRYKCFAVVTCPDFIIFSNASPGGTGKIKRKYPEAGKLEREQAVFLVETAFISRLKKANDFYCDKIHRSKDIFFPN